MEFMETFQWSDFFHLWNPTPRNVMNLFPRAFFRRIFFVFLERNVFFSTEKSSNFVVSRLRTDPSHENSLLQQQETCFIVRFSHVGSIVPQLKCISHFFLTSLPNFFFFPLAQLETMIFYFIFKHCADVAGAKRSHSSVQMFSLLALTLMSVKSCFYSYLISFLKLNRTRGKQLWKNLQNSIIPHKTDNNLKVE